MTQSNFFAMLSRMKYIDRWSLMHSNRKENLSEHTLDVAIIIHALITIHNKRFGGCLDGGKAVLYAMYHDCSEILTGDLPTPVKYFNKDIKTAYKEVEANANKKLLSMLPKDLEEEYQEFFTQASEEYEKYSRFIKAADKLSALIKCIEEARMGNGEFQKAYSSILSVINDMNLPEVEIFLDEFIPPYTLTLDELY